MPTPTYISSLTDAGVEDPKDKFPIQRQVLGIWTDYHTNIEAYFGPVTTVVYEWDGQVAFGETITCPPGKLLVFVQGIIVFTPGDSPTLETITLTTVQGGSIGFFNVEYFDSAEGQGVTFYPASDPAFDPYVDMNQDLTISSSFPGVGTYSGSTRIIIQYLLIDAV